MDVDKFSGQVVDNSSGRLVNNIGGSRPPSDDRRKDGLWPIANVNVNAY